MRKSLRSKSVVALLAAATLSFAVPGAASAADHSTESAAYTNFCATGWVAPLGAYGYIRSLPQNAAGVLETVWPGEIRKCAVGVYMLGDRYSGCGVSNANGWIEVQATDGDWGWAAMTCWSDFH